MQFPFLSGLYTDLRRSLETPEQKRRREQSEASRAHLPQNRKRKTRRLMARASRVANRPH